VISGYNENKVRATVQGPTQEEELYVNSEKEGHFDVKVEENGEYRTCFTNYAKNPNHVTVFFYDDFEPAVSPVTPFFVDMVEFYLNQTSQALNDINLNLNFQRTREAIHEEFMDRFTSKITWTAFFKIVVLVAFAAGQIFILTGFLKVRAKQTV